MSELFDDLDTPPDKPFDIVISEKEPFVTVPVSIIMKYGKDLGITGLACYVALKSHANRSQGMRTFVATKTIAEELGCGESTVRRELTKMATLGLITKHLRTGRSTVYYIRQPRYLIAEGPLPNSATPLPNSDITRRSNQKNLTTDETGKVKASPETPIPSLHAQVAEVIQRKFQAHNQIKCPWDGSEASLLKKFIDSNPSWTFSDFSRMVNNRFDSDGINGERPRVWIANLSKYAISPLDVYGHPKGLTRNGKQGFIDKLEALRRADGSYV